MTSSTSPAERRAKNLLILQLTLIVLLSFPVLSNALTPFYSVTSNSMLPVLKVGSIVLAHRHLPADLNDLKGKIVVYFNPQSRSIVVHRAVGTAQGRLITKGDNNPEADAYQPEAGNILGIVYAHS